MKKITALIMMAILVTIGGVYAAWVYDDGAPSTKTESALSVIIKAPETQGNSGSFTIGSLVEVAIDDIDDEHIHKAELVCTGSITITFTPSAHVGEEIKTNGIRMKVTPAVESEATYGDGERERKIITTNGPVYSPALNQPADDGKDEVGTFVKNTDGSFVWTIGSSDILGMLTLYEGEDLILESSAEHAAFMNELAGHHNIKFTVEQVTPAA